MKSNNPKHRSLAYQIILFIFFFIFVILLTSILITGLLMSRVMLKNAEVNVEYLANQNIYQIENRLNKIQTHAKDISSLLQADNVSTNVIEHVIKSILDSNPEIEAFCIALNKENHNVLPRARIFYKQGVIHKEYNLSGKDFLYKDWFHIPLMINTDYWSEPWFEHEALKKTITSYSLPIKSDDELIGVLRVDISVSYLQKMIMPVRLKKTGYAFLLTHKGTIMSHPADSLIMNETIFSMAQSKNDIQLRNIGKSMVKGDKAFVKLSDSATMTDKWIYYAPLISNSWSLGIVISNSEVFRDLYVLLIIQALVAILAFVFLAVIVYARTLHIYRPLRRLTLAAKVIGEGNFDTEIPLSNTVNEISMLEEALTSMKQSLKDYIRNLEKTTDEKNRIQTEVRFASEIQRNLIPDNSSPLCNSSEFKIYGILEPASDIGGDFYDYFMIDDDHLCFIIADVLGKGVGAAMTMIMISTLIRAKVKEFKTITKLLNDVNIILCENNHESNFVTLILGILNIKNGELV